MLFYLCVSIFLIFFSNAPKGTSGQGMCPPREEDINPVKEFLQDALDSIKSRP